MSTFDYRLLRTEALGMARELWAESLTRAALNAPSDPADDFHLLGWDPMDLAVQLGIIHSYKSPSEAIHERPLS